MNLVQQRKSVDDEDPISTFSITKFYNDTSSKKARAFCWNFFFENELAFSNCRNKKLWVKLRPERAKFLHSKFLDPRLIFSSQTRSRSRHLRCKPSQESFLWKKCDLNIQSNLSNNENPKIVTVVDRWSLYNQR